MYAGDMLRHHTAASVRVQIALANEQRRAQTALWLKVRQTAKVTLLDQHRSG